MRTVRTIRTFKESSVLERRDNRLTLSGDRVRIDLSVMAPDLFRLRATARRAFSTQPSWAVDAGNWPPVHCQVSHTNKRVRIATQSGALHANLQTGQLQLLDSDGQTLLAGSEEVILTSAPNDNEVSKILWSSVAIMTFSRNSALFAHSYTL